MGKQQFGSGHLSQMQVRLAEKWANTWLHPNVYLKISSTHPLMTPSDKTHFPWPSISKARGEMTSDKTVHGLLPSVSYTATHSAVTCVFVNSG